MVVAVRPGIPVGPAMVCWVTRPRVSKLLHDHAVSPVVLVPTVRPHVSYAYSVTIAGPVAGVGPVTDLVNPYCFVPAGIPHTAGAVSRSP